MKATYGTRHGRKRERQEMLARALQDYANAPLRDWNGTAIIAAHGVRQLLELEAAKPMRGGDRELGADSLFGDGMKQGSLF